MKIRVDMHVDMDALARILNENSMRLSRTRKGVSDTGTSAQKRALLLSGEELGRRSQENEKAVREFIFASRPGLPPRDWTDVRDLVYRIADTTNDGLLPSGRLRTWPISPGQRSLTDGRTISGPQEKVEPADLQEAIDDFCRTVFRRWPELAGDPVPLASWAEWELNGGKLHPFYDGCGRIARAFGAMLLLRGGSLPPLYDSAASYFEHGNRGPEAFAEYVRQRIAACAAWIAGQADASGRQPPGS